MRPRIRKAGAVAALLSLAAAGLAAQRSGGDARFEAADIYVRPRSTSAIPAMTAPMLRGARYDIRSATLVDLIRTAYGVDREKVLGGPSWLDWNRFDIVAKAPPATPPETIAVMLQALLAERFTLVVHRDTKALPGFALVAGSGRPKFKEAAAQTPGICDALPNQPAGPAVLAGIACHAVTMETLATTLRTRGGSAGYFSGDLVDLTGLKGLWDLELRFTPKLQLGRAGADGVPLPAALDQQLGLKLEARDVPAPVLIVDSVNDTPAANPSGVAATIPAPPPAEFDVAEITMSTTNGQTKGSIQPGGRVEFQDISMRTLLRLAWNLTDDELLVGPKWLDTTKYNLIAKTTTAIAGTQASMQIALDEVRLMLRALLVDRFKLETHSEDRPVSAYTLLADKPKMRSADPLNRTNCREGVPPGVKDPRDGNPMLSRLLTCQNITAAQFVEELPRLAGGYIHVPVVDGTGLAGSWDFTLTFSGAGQVNGRGADQGQAAGAAPTAVEPTGGVSLFDALDKQLGLKLEMRKRPIPVLVIDRAEEKPSDR